MLLLKKACLWNRNSAWILLVICLGLCAGCAPSRPSTRPTNPLPADLGKVVVVGFRSALEKGSSPDVIRSTISGDAFTAQAVPKADIRLLTERLFQRLVDSGLHDLVSPSQARGVHANLVSSRTILSEIEILTEIGNAFSADAVLAGYVYRWKEREGQDYAVRTPASVAYDLYLIHPEDGRVLWKGQFDMTQRSLSENLLEMDTFLRGGGKWMTASQLADMGLDRMLGDMSRAAEPVEER